MNWKSIFITRKQDNTRAPGFIVYAILAGLILFMFYRCSGTEEAKTTKKNSTKIEVRAVNSKSASVQNAGKVKDEATPFDKSSRTNISDAMPKEEPTEDKVQSVFLESVNTSLLPPPTRPVENFERKQSQNALDIATNENSTETNGLVAKRIDVTSQKAFDPQMTTPETLKTTETLQVDLKKLQIYKRDTTKKPEEKPKVTGFTTNKFLPRGSTFDVAILGEVRTLPNNGLIEMGVVQNAVFNHKIQLPFGTRLYGKMEGVAIRDRVQIEITHIVYPDGKEQKIKGVIRGKDGHPGVPGTFIPEPAFQQLFPYITAAATGYIEAAKTGATTISAGGTTVTEQTTNKQKDAIMSAAQAAMAEGFKRKQAEFDNRFQPYVLIKDGEIAEVQLSEPLDLTLADTTEIKISIPSATAK